MENSTDVEALFEKYFAGTCTPDETIKAQQYMRDPRFYDLLDRFMDNKWKETLDQENFHPGAFSGTDRYRKIRDRIKPNRKPVLLFRVAAALLMMMVAGSLYLYRSALLNTFFPIKMISLSTKPGEQLTVTLPDGSKVWLNTASTLQYPDAFRGETRDISLTGEAFFKVAPDQHKPFIVRAGQFYTKVLGTAFNVKAYAGADEDICVTVEEGKVAIGMEDEAHKPSEFGRLTQNHRATFDRKSNILFRDSVDSWQTMAWREGRLIFREASLEEIASTLERWFGVRIDVQPSAAGRCPLSATYYKGVKLRDILEAMRMMGGIEYEFTESAVKIRAKNNCKN